MCLLEISTVSVLLVNCQNIQEIFVTLFTPRGKKSPSTEHNPVPVLYQSNSPGCPNSPLVIFLKFMRYKEVVQRAMNIRVMDELKNTENRKNINGL